ncbi:MAG: FAD-binding oxidoreductase [Coriobacteriia bacterium]|nr:FAD-binding oxidoreductase [Coriobacteriia bacterium]
MKVIDETIGEKILAIVGPERYRDDRRERKAYSSDIGAMPSLVKPFIKAGVSGGVARPANEEQLVALVKLAAREGLQMVARAGATSGYGGVLPRKGTLVIDMNSFNKLLSVDADKLIVRAQAGAIWEEIDKQILPAGLEIALHPSSYPSSTVGGWLAQGGNGFGSFEYGSFKDNVLAARVILPDGSAHEYTGEDLMEKIADAEGMTGIITEVSFGVRRKEEQALRLVSFATAAALSQALKGIYDARLPIWSISFLNPTAVSLKSYLPPRHVHEYQVNGIAEEFAVTKSLPVSYLAMIVFPQARLAEVDEPLTKLIGAAGGLVLSPEAAAAEWEHHTAPMRLKRIGPSIIPTEVIVPLGELTAVLDRIDQVIKQSFILEGSVSTNGKVTLLGFIPHDERKFSFNMAFALAVSVIKIAKAHGGYAYSTGLYFRREAKSVLGAARVARLRSHKDQVDPQGLMNPGKVYTQSGGRLLDTIMGAVSVFEPLIRPIANAAKVKLPATSGSAEAESERIMASATRHGIPADVAYMSYACARCGYCVPTCEQYMGRGWESQSPRGKYSFLREVLAGRERWDRKSVDTFLLCTTCERCDFRCQLQLPVEHSGMALRGALIHEEGHGTFPPFEMMAASLKSEGDIWAGKREHRADWLPADVAARLTSGSDADVLYFAGCTSSYVETDIAEATIRLLLDTGLKVAYLGEEERCCGIPMKMSGRWNLFTQMYAENTAAVRRSGAKEIVTSCPACALVWKELYAEEAHKHNDPYDFKVKHYSQIIGPAVAEGRLTLKTNPLEGQRVTFHDSCHAGRAQGIYEEPRQMLAGIPGIDLVEMKHNREKGICCGSVLTLVGEIDKAPRVGKIRLDEAIDADVETVVAMCPCCQVQLRDSVDKNKLPLTIDDLSRIVAVAAGYDIPTSQEHTTYMWGLFDIFIRLMAPAEMAKLMQKVFPEMLDAMPMRMGPMMRGLAKLPGGPALMRKMMPVMFPKMAPGILGKVMPRLVDEVASHVGTMPPDMQELMPDLLPKTMEALIPTYMPQLIPYLVPLFIGYLHREKSKVAA